MVLLKRHLVQPAKASRGRISALGGRHPRKTKGAILVLAMSVLILTGCAGTAEAARPIGTLKAIEYSRRTDMIWGENYRVRVTPEEIESVEYFVPEDGDYRLETGVSLEEGQWQALEAAAQELLPGLTVNKKQPLWKRLFQKTMPLPKDGSDTATLSLDWETEDGVVTVSYQWKHDDPKAQTLLALLNALQHNSKEE